MTPHMERGASLAGEPLANAATAKPQVPAQSRTRTRRKPTPTPVIAHAYGVIGGTGRHRWLLLFRCLLCGQHHVAHGRGQLPPTLERPAACGRGRLALIPVTVQRTGAA